jgi:hypothetical protein
MTVLKAEDRPKWCGQCVFGHQSSCGNAVFSVAGRCSIRRDSSRMVSAASSMMRFWMPETVTLAQWPVIVTVWETLVRWLHQQTLQYRMTPVSP